MGTYNRYAPFVNGNEVEIVPFIEIPKKSTDFYETYYKGKTRLDQLSYKYYENGEYGWLILLANPELGSIEFEIPDRSEVRIPYPLSITLSRYQDDIENRRKLYK